MQTSPQGPEGLTADNFRTGVLLDPEWMAGVHEEEQGYSAFVLDHQQGEMVGYHFFPTLHEALGVLNAMGRPWEFSPLGGGCGGKGCEESGQCNGCGACGS